MHEEFNPITWLKPKMFANRFRDGGLALDGNRRFHTSPLHINKCNTTTMGCKSSREAMYLREASADEKALPSDLTPDPAGTESDLKLWPFAGKPVLTRFRALPDPQLLPWRLVKFITARTLRDTHLK
jgi:hypothetical protein